MPKSKAALAKRKAKRREKLKKVKKKKSTGQSDVRISDKSRKSGINPSSEECTVPSGSEQQFSSNWKSLAKQLGLNPTRKEDRQGDQQEPGNSSGAVSVPHNGEIKGDRHKRKRKRTGAQNSRTKTASQNSDSIHGHSSRKRDRTKIWFDDVPLEMVDGEPVPKKTKMSTTSLLVTGNDKTAGKYVSLDCEMVGTGHGGDFSMLARCSIVNHHGNVLFDSYVAPMDRVTDYRTEFSGIRPRDLVGAPDFRSVQKSVSDIISGRKLVGHGLQNDLKVLLLSHPKKDIRDTSKYKSFRALSKGGTPSLCKLANEILGVDIQDKEHDSVEDARVSMKLYQLHKQEWEESLRRRPKRLCNSEVQLGSSECKAPGTMLNLTYIK